MPSAQVEVPEALYCWVMCLKVFLHSTFQVVCLVQSHTLYMLYCRLQNEASPDDKSSELRRQEESQSTEKITDKD